MEVIFVCPKCDEVITGKYIKHEQEENELNISEGCSCSNNEQWFVSILENWSKIRFFNLTKMRMNIEEKGVKRNEIKKSVSIVD